MGPAHQEVAGEDLVEDIVKLILNDSNKGERRVLLYCSLCPEAGVYFLCRFQERCELKNCWVALLRSEQDRHHDEPLLHHLC